MYIHVWTMYIHVYRSLCTYHCMYMMYIRVQVTVHSSWFANMYVHVWNMYMRFHFCTYHVCQLLSIGTVHSMYIHTWNMYVHVYTMWSGFQMRSIDIAYKSVLLSIVYDGIYFISKVYTIINRHIPEYTMIYHILVYTSIYKDIFSYFDIWY